MRKWCLGLLFVALAVLIVYLNRDSGEIGTIDLHIGKPYKDVLRDSTFPVKSETAMRATTPQVEDSTWITRPAIVKFDDPKHGFTLPPTKFGAIGYNRGKVTTFTTSPMLETLPFDQVIPLFNNLQEMLKGSGWTLEKIGSNALIKASSEAEKNALQLLLFKHAETVIFFIPHKYSLALTIKCYARCNERDVKTAKYLIDVSVGRDYSNR
ncbi:hypothetical protein [Pseudomonas paraveronii]|uniref:hypothetical protein n=1 Tax=Pseudomonas paraveronii TaxID=3040598 RepID=UPI002AAF6D69|nr:hypothetical protein [Pseudomonas sp. V3/K/3/5]